MPTQTFIDLFNKVKDDQNAHKIISLLHLMLHMDAERLDGGEQAPPPVCVQTEELLEEKAAVKKLSEKVEHQKVILRQLEQKNKDMNTQLRELHNKYLLISEMNKRLYVKSKRLNGAYKELCHQNTAAKEEMKEQRALILDLQQRLGGLEATKKQKDELLASEEVKQKDAFKREVVELCLQVKIAKDEMKEQRSLLLDLQQRLDRLEATRQQKDAALAVSQLQEAQKKSSTKAGKEEVKGKQSKMANGASGKQAAEADAKEQRKAESKEPSAAALKPKNRNTNCKDKVAACSRTGATAKAVSGDNSTRKPRNATAPKGQSDKPGTEKKAAADRRKPRITFDSRPNLKGAKPGKAPAQLEKKDSKLPPINKDRTAPVHRARLKENLLPGRLSSNKSGTSVTNAVQTSRETSLRTPVQVLQDSAKTRIPKLPPLGTKALFPHHNSHKFTGAKAPPEVVSAAPESIEERSPLFPVTNIDFQRDEDFSPWEHERLVQSSNDDGEDNE